MTKTRVLTSVVGMCRLALAAVGCGTVGGAALGQVPAPRSAPGPDMIRAKLR